MNFDTLISLKNQLSTLKLQPFWDFLKKVDFLISWGVRFTLLGLLVAVALGWQSPAPSVWAFLGVWAWADVIGLLMKEQLRNFVFDRSN
jgi:hypothetical protein